jgi:hypothetical protein
MIAHSSWSSAFFLNLLTPSAFRSSSTQSSHLNFHLPGFLLPPGLPWNTLFTVLSPSILTTWPANSNWRTFISVTTSALLCWTFNSLFLQIFHSFVSVFRHYPFLKIFLSHSLSSSSICSDIFYPSHPYMTIVLIIDLYIFSLVPSDISHETSANPYENTECSQFYPRDTEYV